MDEGVRVGKAVEQNRVREGRIRVVCNTFTFPAALVCKGLRRCEHDGSQSGRSALRGWVV
jgi:hypothetical protein